MLHGEDMSSLLMSIIRFVLPSRNHTIKVGHICDGGLGML